MTRTLVKLSLGMSLALLALPSDVLAGRGGGRGGGMQRGGGGGGMQRGGGGMQRGGGGMQRGGGGGQQASGSMQRGGGGGYGGGSNHSPSFSQPRPPENASSSGNRNPYASNSGAGARGAGSNNSNGGAAAGAGYANRNQSSPTGGAAAGAGYANRNQSTAPNNGAAAAGAGYANRNQSTLPNNGAAAAGAGYANRNQSTLPNNGAAAAGAGYANRNQSNYPNAGAAAAGATYANRNNANANVGAAALGYGMGASNWNGNNSGAWGMAAYNSGYGGVGAWGTGSPMYGWGYSNYSNPYYGNAGGGGGQQVVTNAPQDGSQSQPYDYAQPISTTAAAPAPAAADQSASTFDQARQAFKAGDYAQAVQLDQQVLALSPNDPTAHEFLALALFAQGKYEQAAAPLYAVLSVGPGWDWTTLSGMYPDVDTYTAQVRKLEAYIRANTSSAQARFVLAYHYLCQGHDASAATQFKDAAKLQPGDTLSAQFAAQYQPAGSAQPAPTPPPAADGVGGKLAGTWSAAPARGAKINLTIGDDGGFSWSASAPGKPATTIAGTSTLDDGVLTLNAKGAQDGALAGNVAWQDADHFTFRLVSAPPTDPGLNFAR